MQPLAGIIALQECMLAGLILLSIPAAPTQQQWPGEAACLCRSSPNDVAAAPGCTLSDVILLVVLSCLGGFFVGRRSAQAGLWPLLQQQQSHELQQHSSGCEWALDSPSRAAVQLLKYAALAWQQLRHVMLGLAAAGAKCTAAVLALLAAKASDAAAAASEAAAAAAVHVPRNKGVQYLGAPIYDGADEVVRADNGIPTSPDEDFGAPSFVTFLANNEQQPAVHQQQPQQHQQQQQQQLVACWQGGSQCQSPAPPAAAAAAGSLTFPAHCNSSSRNSSSSSLACRNTAGVAATAPSAAHGVAGPFGGGSSSISGSKRQPLERSNSVPLPASGPASVNIVTPLGCGWMCVLSRSSQAVEAAACQQQQQQQPGCDSLYQPGSEDISLGVVLGCGAHGKVYKGQWRGQPVAVKVLYHSGQRAAAHAAHETSLMLQACHTNVVQTHHVLMWQRAKAAIDDCAHEFGAAAGGSATQREQHVLSPFAQHSSWANNSTSVESAAAAAGGEEDVAIKDSGRRYSNLHVDNSTGTGVSACGVMELSAAEADAADAWLGQAGIMEDDEDDMEAQTWIVQELCDGGPLDAAARNGRLTSTECMLSCLLDVARGLEYLHSKGLMHGDLKADNVCLVSTGPAADGSAGPAACNGHAEGGKASNSSNASGFNYVCKVMDFSLSKALDAGKTHCSTQSLGTITHMAPELLLTGKQSKAADVYSMGMLIWEVLHGGQTPFRECSHSMEVMQLVLQKQRPRWQPGCSPELIALAEQCWAADPAARPCISMVCEQLLQLQLTLQLQHIDMAGWPSSGAWLPAASPAAGGGGGAGGGAAHQAGSVQSSSSRRGSGSSSSSGGSGSTAATSFYGVAAAAVAAAADADAAVESSSGSGSGSSGSSSGRPPALPAGFSVAAAGAVGNGRPPVRKSVSFYQALPAAAAGGLHAIPEAVTPEVMVTPPSAAAALPGLPRSAGAVLQTYGSSQTLDQFIQGGLNPVGSSSCSSRVSMARRHSVAHVDSVSQAFQSERLHSLRAARNGSGRAEGSSSVEADVSKMHAFGNLLVTGRKAVARGVDCSALDALSSQEDLKQSGSAWPVQQQQHCRVSASGSDVAQCAVSEGYELGPTVGYWD